MPTDLPQEEEVALARAQGAAGGGRAGGARRLELKLLVGAAPPELRAWSPSRSSQARAGPGPQPARSEEALSRTCRCEFGRHEEEKDGALTARVLFDGTNGTYVNASTHLREQERSPVAGDIKRFMREKARVGEPTFGLTADIKEAQIPIHSSDWAHARVAVGIGRRCVREHRGHVWSLLSVLLVEPSLNSSWQIVPVHCCSLRDIVGPPPRRRLPFRDGGVRTSGRHS